MVFRLAVMAVRMERCVYYETATLSAKANEIINDETIETETELRHALALARFDHSPESTAVRRYEAAASREFFKTLHLLKARETSNEMPQTAATLAASPMYKAASAELASSCQVTPAQVKSAIASPTPVVLPSVAARGEAEKGRLGGVRESSSGYASVNFAIGKPPGSQS